MDQDMIRCVSGLGYGEGRAGGAGLVRAALLPSLNHLFYPQGLRIAMENVGIWISDMDIRYLDAHWFCVLWVRSDFSRLWCAVLMMNEISIGGG